MNCRGLGQEPKPDSASKRADSQLADRADKDSRFCHFFLLKEEVGR